MVGSVGKPEKKRSELSAYNGGEALPCHVSLSHMGKVYHTTIDYERYLKSGHWEGIKARMYLKHKKCQAWLCDAKYDLQVHHNEGYTRLGFEKLSELRLYCGEDARGCHYRHHRLKRGILALKPSDYMFYMGRAARLFGAFFFR